tara:strand:+ start:249 stop:605 length:357 start_codon:yes stop_codon:yes gene_type:complete
MTDYVATITQIREDTPISFMNKIMNPFHSIKRKIIITQFFFFGMKNKDMAYEYLKKKCLMTTPRYEEDFRKANSILRCVDEQKPIEISNVIDNKIQRNETYRLSMDSFNTELKIVINE